MRDYQTQRVIDTFFRREEREKKLENMRLWKKQGRSTRSKNKQKKKKGYKVRGKIYG
ncbi:hypothetical protein ES705_14739 [subsurface metagenome]